MVQTRGQRPVAVFNTIGAYPSASLEHKSKLYAQPSASLQEMLQV